MQDPFGCDIGTLNNTMLQLRSCWNSTLVL